MFWLLSAGHHVTVYNRTRRCAEDLERFGASIAESPDGSAESADIVLSSVALPLTESPPAGSR